MAENEEKKDPFTPEFRAFFADLIEPLSGNAKNIPPSRSKHGPRPEPPPVTPADTLENTTTT